MQDEIQVEGQGKTAEEIAKAFFAALYGSSLSVVRKMGLSKETARRNEDGSFGPIFTGWKGGVDEGFCGQLVFYYPRENLNSGVYVNLPGGECGSFERPENPPEGFKLFNIGTARVWTDMSEEEAEAMLSEGLKKLKSLIRS